MKILNKKITAEELKKIAEETFGDMVKAVVDIERELIAIDAELHSDLESLLLNNGSEQKNIWGINFYPDIKDDGFMEFDSMINIRPAQGNRSRGIESEALQTKVRNVVNQWVVQ